MKRIILFLFVVFLFGINPLNNAYASWSFNLLAADDTHFDLKFITNEGAIESWNFTLVLGYSDNISLLDASMFIPNGFMGMGPVAHDSTSKTISNLSGMSFGSSLNSGITIASFTIETLPGVKQDGVNDIFFEFQNDNFGGKFKGNEDSNIVSGKQLMDDGHLTFGAGLDVGDPVPIPSAIFLLGGGICALFGIGRRKDRG